MMAALLLWLLASGHPARHACCMMAWVINLLLNTELLLASAQ